MTSCGYHTNREGTWPEFRVAASERMSISTTPPLASDPSKKTREQSGLTLRMFALEELH